jgi:hypothetical protein
LPERLIFNAWRTGSGELRGFFTSSVFLIVGMRPAELLVALLGVYFLWVGKLLDLVLIIIIWLLLLFTRQL